MPQRPAAMGRPPAVRHAPQARDADIEPRRREEDARQGGPDHHLRPELGVLAQHMRIEPVRHRPQPGPEAARPIGRLRHLAGPICDIDDGARRVAEAHAVDRPPVEGAFNGPLVVIDQPGLGAHGGHALAGRKAVGDRRRLGGPDMLDRRAAPQVYDATAFGPRQAQHRPIRQHLDPQVPDRRLAEIRRLGHAAQVERPQPGHPLGRRHRRIAAIHHDEAGQAPERHHQADDHAQVAMDDQDEPHRPSFSRGAPPDPDGRAQAPA